jgi:CHRD domain
MVAKGRRSLAVLAICALGALLLALPSFASEATPLAKLEASLTGEKEAPGPGDKDGLGDADVKVYKARVCYELEVRRIKPATAAHIHLGLSGEAGPIVAELKAPTDGSSGGCVAVPRALSLGLKEHPDWYYVNVHNKPYTDGAIRGQLHR